jgi:endonuclease/exonuclease/phosphatase family metal-dependent hydrolase
MNVVPLAAMLLLGPMSSASQADNGTSGLRVMTFNVLHSSIRNVVGTWQIRRPRVVRTIRTASPDVACLQEVSDRQLADLARDLPEYEVVGGERSGASSHFSWCMAIAGLMTTSWLLLKRSQSGSRLLAVVGVLSAAGAIVAVVALFAIRFIQGDFVERGERCPILVRRDRLALERHGSFWDSGEPDRPGSKLPGSPSPHVVTWADLIDRRTGAKSTVYSTHLGMIPWTGRRSAATLRARLDRDWRGWPQILAGDFNTPPSGILLRSLMVDGDTRAFHDAWSESASRAGTGSTFHWGVGRAGPRIDYVLVRPRLPVAGATTIVPPSPPFPSDHYPLVVTLGVSLRVQWSGDRREAPPEESGRAAPYLRAE